MKQIKIVKAYQNTNSIAGNKTIPAEVQWDIFQLRKKLSDHVDFYNEQSEAIRERYVPLADENGELRGKPFEDYMKEMNELNDMDKDVSGITKIIVPLAGITGITALEMEALEDFIDFKK